MHGYITMEYFCVPGQRKERDRMNECVYLANYACYISSGAENTSLAQKEGSNMIAREGIGDVIGQENR